MEAKKIAIVAGIVAVTGLGWLWLRSPNGSQPDASLPAPAGEGVVARPVESGMAKPGLKPVRARRAAAAGAEEDAGDGGDAYADEEYPEEDYADEEWPEDEEFLEDEPYVEPEPWTVAQFTNAFLTAMASNDTEAIYEAIGMVPADPAAERFLIDVASAGHHAAELRAQAREGLMGIGSTGAVAFVASQVLEAALSGDEDRWEQMLQTLEYPVSPEGAQVFLDILMGRGAYVEAGRSLSENAREALRRAVRNGADPEAIGAQILQIYLDPAMADRKEALRELFAGISHPTMLSRLALQLHQSGQTEETEQVFDQLASTDDPGVVAAVIDLGTADEKLTWEAGEVLCEWSRENPEEAWSGLFLEYVSDQSLSPYSRIVAACGLEGCADREDAIAGLESALEEEADAEVRKAMETILARMKAAR